MAARHEHGAELFTRGVQANIGMGFGVLAFSVAMGALFAVVFCVAYGRVGNVSARILSVLVAGGMLISLWVVPALKYPPNPPATSLTETINQRSLLYLLMVVLSALLMVAAVYLGRQLNAKLGAWNATLVAAGAYLVAVLVVMLILPTINETPGPMRRRRGRHRLPGFPGGRPLRIPPVRAGHAGGHLGDHRPGVRRAWPAACWTEGGRRASPRARSVARHAGRWPV